MAEIGLEEFAKELKLIKVVGYIYAVVVMVTIRQGFMAITRAFTMVIVKVIVKALSVVIDH